MKKYTFKELEIVAKYYQHRIVNNIYTNLTEKEVDALLKYNEDQKELTRKLMFGEKVD